jgi:glycosyltransferase involved in cell wall biosynthesis
MVVLIVIARFEFGGIPTQAFLWAQFLKRNNYEPVVIALENKDDRYCQMLAEHGIRYGLLALKSKSSNSVRYFTSMISSLNSYKPYAILPFNKTLAYNINLIWRFTSARKCFFLERTSGDDPTTRIGSMVRKVALLNSTGLIYNSFCASTQSLFPKKTYVIKNTFTPPASELQGQSKDLIPGLPENAFVLLHIANFTKHKNYELLLKAWPALRDRFPDMRLVIVGGEIREKFPETLSRLKVPGIIYLGSQSNVLPLIQKADLCLLSTFSEGCPNVVLEYIFHNKLICASDIPPIREVLSEQNYKLLFDNNSADDFIAKISLAHSLEGSSAGNIIKNNYAKLMRDYSENNYKSILDLL